MFQILLICAVLLLFFLYLKSKEGLKIKKPKDELELRCDFFHQQVINFLNRLRRSRSKTRIRRLESEIERFQKAMDLDDILERAEKETNPQRAIDLYLEALSFIMKNDFEKERKAEIEEKIKALQQSRGKQVLR
ncbi:MAG TPA: hypothetical protein ENL39_05660 [Candidatus Aerophobetes bacterium]|uniref:Uncharacterized protein n=1 Tax=Aerophobetes bacterium TaxID=2030807 RepID=A0A7V5HZU1_UNCAE|nr:hypothetical protein [Candidatus Aerophobetes bacterium]